MGKTQKITLLLLIFSLAFIFITFQFNGLNEATNNPINETENQRVNKEKEQKNDANTETPKNDSSSMDEESNLETDTEQSEEQLGPEQPQYFINNNYFIKSVNPDDEAKVVLLTFDDAPQGSFTEQTLDILDKYNAKAIFFVNGHYAIKDTSLLKEIYNRGHVIGNHTWWHYNLKEIDLEKTKEEIIKLNDLIEEITGERPKYFRPPFGVMSDNARIILQEENMQSMNWSLGSLDWEYPKPEQSDKVVHQVIQNIHKGANILMHDKEVTYLALDEILKELKNNGYEFVLPTEVILPSN